MTPAGTDEARVRSFEPADRFRKLFRIGNAFMVPLLRSRLGARMKDLALLTYTGRKTGRRYTIPVGIHELDGDAVVLTASGWKANLRGGAEVEIRTGGRSRACHAEVVEEPDEVARIYGGLLGRVGLSKATRVGLKVDGDRMPTRGELVSAIGDRRAVVRLEPSPS